VVTLAGIFAVAYSLRFIHDVFFNGEPVDLPKTPHEPPRWMKVPVEILVVLCLLVGILPAYTVEPILAMSPPRACCRVPTPDHDLAIWHGFNTALVMSIVALIGGILIYMAGVRCSRLPPIARADSTPRPSTIGSWDGCSPWPAPSPAPGHRLAAAHDPDLHRRRPDLGHRRLPRGAVRP
jgi:NADH:ubiquinone oxidoreductase subunit 5 (subunit L)/multisubunit Na+/H+ antiporter MnhA subunit